MNKKQKDIIAKLGLTENSIIEEIKKIVTI